MNNPLEQLVGALTLGDLAARSGKSVESIVDFAMRGGSASPKNGVTKTVAAKAVKVVSSASTQDVNTRTPAGRDAYDAAVLTFLKAKKGTWVGAGAIRKAVGGSALQVRTTLNRLLENKGVSYRGQARSTQYQA